MGVYYWSLMMYVRNQFMGVTLLFACIQVIIVVTVLHTCHYCHYVNMILQVVAMDEDSGEVARASVEIEVLQGSQPGEHNTLQTQHGD